MSILRSKDGEELILDCNCGCDEGMRMRVNKWNDDNMFFIVTYTSGHFAYLQDDNVFSVIKKKLKKIWRVITNQDYCYSEICMTREDVHELKEYLAEIEKL
jgi:hypothetical protein